MNTQMNTQSEFINQNLYSPIQPPVFTLQPQNQPVYIFPEKEIKDIIIKTNELNTCCLLLFVVGVFMPIILPFNYCLFRNSESVADRNMSKNSMILFIVNVFLYLLLCIWCYFMFYVDSFSKMN